MNDSNTRVGCVPDHAQWLQGQGGGVWFAIDETNGQNKYRIRRFSAQGDLDCDFVFDLHSDGPFNLKDAYEFTFISHCGEVRILQNDQVHFFKVFSTELEQHSTDS